MNILYGHAGRLTAQNGVFRPPRAGTEQIKGALAAGTLQCDSDLGALNPAWAGYKTSQACGVTCGDGPACAAADVDEYIFGGHLIIAEVIEELKSKHGLETADALILTGCSAGALGVFENTDFVASLIPGVAVTAGLERALALHDHASTLYQIH